MDIVSSIKTYLQSRNNINNINYFGYNTSSIEKSQLSKILNINYWEFITHPPLNNSRSTTSDLTEVLRLANNRTLSEEKFVIDVDRDPLNIFMPFIVRYNLNFPNDTMHELYTFLSKIITDLKNYFNRARPFQLAEFYGQKIDVIHTKTHHTPSYPSGHTAYATLIASILSDNYPSYSNIWWDLVNKCGTARILQGVHFASDNTASIELVKRVYPYLVDLNKKFK